MIHFKALSEWSDVWAARQAWSWVQNAKILFVYLADLGLLSFDFDHSDESENADCRSTWLNCGWTFCHTLNRFLVSCHSFCDGLKYKSAVGCSSGACLHKDHVMTAQITLKTISNSVNHSSSLQFMSRILIGLQKKTSNMSNKQDSIISSPPIMFSYLEALGQHILRHMCHVQKRYNLSPKH